MLIQIILPLIPAVLVGILFAYQFREFRRTYRRILGARAELQELLRRTASLDFLLREVQDNLDELTDRLDQRTGPDFFHQALDNILSYQPGKEAEPQ